MGICPPSNKMTTIPEDAITNAVFYSLTYVHMAVLESSAAIGNETPDTILERKALLPHYSNIQYNSGSPSRNTPETLFSSSKTLRIQDCPSRNTPEAKCSSFRAFRPRTRGWCLFGVEGLNPSVTELLPSVAAVTVPPLHVGRGEDLAGH
ncbi:hypothetical protein TNCV_3556811 [Trichonephila clavipes]|uniref:Uncharacterized protein n=1 Tax=Trichonephila clavipes TaxID=2585209 RepID=A0A8X6WC42_TRICX|nr:hypothetical protein TNCV_3556811 [Trichonephila clavipes]